MKWKYKETSTNIYIYIHTHTQGTCSSHEIKSKPVYYHQACTSNEETVLGKNGAMILINSIL